MTAWISPKDQARRRRAAVERSRQRRGVATLVQYEYLRWHSRVATSLDGQVTIL